MPKAPVVVEEEACDFDDPMAMLGGMGEKDSSAVVEVTAIPAAVAAEEEEAADFDDPMAMLGGMGEKDSSAVVEVTAIPAEAKVDPEAEKAAKRAEIMAKVAAAQALREKATKAAAALEIKKKEIEQNGTSYFGEHVGITCDGCATVPIFGYRYLCKTCASHDICESCYDLWAGGTGVMPNGLAKQTLSTAAADHSFKMFKDKTFKSVVKGGGGGATEAKAPKLKPNDTCNCGSGKKYKKCCMNA